MIAALLARIVASMLSRECLTDTAWIEPTHLGSYRAVCGDSDGKELSFVRWTTFGATFVRTDPTSVCRVNRWDPDRCDREYRAELLARGISPE